MHLKLTIDDQMKAATSVSHNVDHGEKTYTLTLTEAISLVFYDNILTNVHHDVIGEIFRF